MTSGYWSLMLAAFLIGLLGSAHCIGMCGGILSSLCYACPSFQRKANKAYYYQLMYHAGRIFSYSLMGGAAGLTGMLAVAWLGGNTSFILRIIAAIAVIFTGLYIAGFPLLLRYLEMLGQFIWQPLSKFTKHFLPVTTTRQALLLGSLWGFLPCGLTYSAILYSLGSNTFFGGAGIMLAFGLGTLPAMLLFGTVLQQYAELIRSTTFRKISGLLVIILGFVALLLILKTHSHLSGSTWLASNWLSGCHL